jgi:hypothetical protein
MYYTAKEQCLEQEEFDQISLMWKPGSLVGTSNYHTNFRRTCTLNPIPHCWDWKIKMGRKIFSNKNLYILMKIFKIWVLSETPLPTQTKVLPKLRD